MRKEYKSALAEHLEKELGPMESRQSLYKKLGIYSPGYYANLDMSNLGIGGRIRIGKRIFYPREEIIQWISERTTEECQTSLKARLDHKHNENFD